ncbi:MAG: hypothetical protein HC904_17590 [Blastochloris sp.]|nr:hypothetical protein [Blastochloris sp.]
MRGEAFVVLSLERAGRHGVTQLQEMVARLWVRGIPVKPGMFFEGRGLSVVEEEEERARLEVPICLNHPIAQVSKEFEEKIKVELKRHFGGEKLVTEGRRWALVDRVLEHELGRRIRVERTFDCWGGDPWLRDHSLAENACRPGSGEHGMIMLPLSFSVEMVLEVAAMLFPGREVERVLKCSARLWAMAEEPLVAEVVLERVGENELKGTLRSAEGIHTEMEVILRGEGKKAKLERPKMEKPGQKLRKPKHTIREIYETGALFHGPRLQCIREVKGLSEDGELAELEMVAAGSLFKGRDGAEFVLNPVFLDGLAQMLGVWFYEVKGNLDAMPLRVEEIQMFGPAPAEGTILRVRMKLRHYHVTAWGDFEVLRSDGSVWLRVNGWQSFRYPQPKFLSAFVQSPADCIVHQSSRVWRERAGMVCVERPVEFEHMKVHSVPTTVYFLMGRRERAWFLRQVKAGAEAEVSMEELGERVLDVWLLKDAARKLLRQEGCAEKLYPTEFVLGEAAEWGPGWYRCQDPVGAGELVLHLRGKKWGGRRVALAGRSREELKRGLEEMEAGEEGKDGEAREERQDRYA